MYRSNNLSNCNFTPIKLRIEKTLRIQYQISNLAAVDPHNFLFKTTRNVFANKLFSTTLLTTTIISFIWALRLSKAIRIQINTTYCM